MNSIYRLLNFLTKAEEGEEDLPFKDFSTPSPTAKVTPTTPMEVGTGGQAASAVSVQTPAPGKTDVKDPTAPEGHDRLYLSEIGGKVPEGFKGKTFTGRQGAQFIDRRSLTPTQKSALNPKDESKDTAYGGIIINDQGQILLREPKDHFGGYHWTFAKGGADEGETPHNTAIREVEEETGLKVEFSGDIPGHFQGTLGNNKFFLMKVVGGDTSLFQTNETSTVQWFDPADAEAQINKTGEENPKGMKRDLDILKAAFHEHHDQKNSKEKMSAMIARASAKPTGQNFKIMDGVEEVGNHFQMTDGDLPTYYTDNENTNYNAYQPFRDAILDRLVNPDNSSHAFDTWISALYNSANFRKKYGYKTNSSTGVKVSHFQRLRHEIQSAHIEHSSTASGMPLACSEYVGEALNSPQTYAHHKSLPYDIDINGNKMYRSMTEREALAKAWEAWKTGGDAKETLQAGQLPSKHDPATGKMQEGDKFDFSVGGWELAGERASVTHKVRTSKGIDSSIKSSLDEAGKGVKKLKIQGKLEEKWQAGERIMRDFVRIHRKLNTQLLHMAFPNADHMVLYRGTGAIQEIAHGTDIAGTKMLDPDDLKKYGMPSANQETVDNTYESYINSRPMSGWSVHPISVGGSYHFAAEVPFSNVFMSSLDMGWTVHANSEKEWMVLNDTNMRAKVLNTASNPGLLHDSQDWEQMPEGNGIAIKGLFHGKKGLGVTVKDEKGKLHTWNVGVDEPDKDWSTLGTLEKKLGSRPGGMFTDPDGQKWYIKHGHEDQHTVEDLANKVYRHAGIKVPETKLINWKGKVAYASKILDDVDTSTPSYTGEALKNKPDIHDGFLVDALLGNWDVAGTGYSNILPTKNGEHYRIDNGGSLYLRAKGEKKPFGPTDDMKSPIEELSSFKNSLINKETATVFSGMTNASLNSSLEKLGKLNNTSIANLVHASGIPPYRMEPMTKALISRRNNIVQWLVDNNHISDSFKEVEEWFSLRKAETIMEDNPTKNEALEILKKRPLLNIVPTGGYTQREDMNDTERN